MSSAEGANSAVTEKPVETRNSFHLELPPHFDFLEKLCTVNIKIVKYQLLLFVLIGFLRASHLVVSKIVPTSRKPK